MSLWKVPDLATTELMRRFYANLWEQKMGPAAALRSAQVAMSAKFPAEAASWAGWTLVGAGW